MCILDTTRYIVSNSTYKNTVAEKGRAAAAALAAPWPREAVPGRVKPRLGRVWPRLGRVWPRLGRVWPHIGRVWPRLGRARPREAPRALSAPGHVGLSDIPNSQLQLPGDLHGQASA